VKREVKKVMIKKVKIKKKNKKNQIFFCLSNNRRSPAQIFQIFRTWPKKEYFQNNKILKNMEENFFTLEQWAKPCTNFINN